MLVTSIIACGIMCFATLLVIKCPLCDKKYLLISHTIITEGNVIDNTYRTYIICNKCCKKNRIQGSGGAYIAITNKKHLDVLKKRSNKINI
jgi:hypothetical protein